MSCAECHLDANDPTVLGCAGCHEQAPTGASHVGVPGYQWSSPACLSCHPDGSVGAAAIDHTPYFPIEPGTDHQAIGCGECHTNQNDLSINGCASCHFARQNIAGSHDLVQRNLSQTDSTDCKLCHADGQIHRLNQHGQFRINGGPHKRKCLECHKTNRTDKPFGRDFGQFTCIECHEHRESKMADKHSGRNGYRWESAACINCHPDGRE